jgi:cytosine/adenosine deaminase-related metal-dependent hydrolase
MLGLDADTEAESYVLQGNRVALFGMRAPASAERLDCTGAAIVPGFVNCHTHLYSGLSGLDMPRPNETPRTFVEILERIWWRLDRALDHQSLRAAARLYVAEALMAGTTAVVDHHESPTAIDRSLEVVADACEDLGIRAVLCYGATERNGGRDEAKQGLAECSRFIRENRRGRVAGMVGLHAGFTVSDETIRDAGQLSRQLGAPIHLHAGEDGVDTAAAQERGYPGALARLKELGALMPGSILAHGVHLSESEIRGAAGSGCWLIHNPRSNAHNGVGCARLAPAGDRVALGTDGFPADMLEEMAAWSAIAEREPASEKADPRRLVAGHRLIGEHFAARFAPPMAGTIADLVVLEPATATEARARVRHVVVDGQVVVRNGTLLTGDIDVIRGEAMVESRRLWERMERL